jgi:UDP-glucuronate decarboxylase
VYGQGRQTRSFCYVDDLVSGLISLMDSDEGVTGPFNLGNPDEFTMEELAHEVLRQTGSASPLVYRELPYADPKQRRPDISQARSVLNWAPRVKLQEGVARTIAHFQMVLGSAPVAISPAHAPASEAPDLGLSTFALHNA